MKLTTEQQEHIKDMCEIDQQELDQWMLHFEDIDADELIDWIFQSQLSDDIDEMMDGFNLSK